MSKEIITTGIVQSAGETETAFHITFDKPLFNVGDDVEVFHPRSRRWHPAQVKWMSLALEFVIECDKRDIGIAKGYGWRYCCEIKDLVDAFGLDALHATTRPDSIRAIESAESEAGE